MASDALPFLNLAHVGLLYRTGSDCKIRTTQSCILVCLLSLITLTLTSYCKYLLLWAISMI
jgi:hypothetical protein